MQAKKLGRYELIAVLGKGAMGVVYEGRDPNLDRRVAIKTIMVDDLAPVAAAEYEARFRTEARSAARLQHPHIVTVYDSDRDGDTAFLVMEFVQGEDLKQRLDRGERFAPADALRLVLDLLAALDFAHRQGIVHRDVKPANLLVDPAGRLKLTDFGIARITGEATRTHGSMIGTLKYMAPEQVQGQKVDARADQFSAAVVAYQLFTGTRPFDGDNDFSIIHQVVGQQPAPPSSVAPGLPGGLDEVIARAMAKDKQQRFASAGDFATALEEVFADAGVQPSAGVPKSQPPWVGETILRPLPTAPGSRSRTVPGARGHTIPGARGNTVPGAAANTVPGAPITQELELEYWRAVRDSTDPHELEGFLARFPEGIYADLARRRLERLCSPDADPDRTILQGVAAPQESASEGSAPAARQSSDPTLPIEPARHAPSPAPAARHGRAGARRRWWPAAAAAVLVLVAGVGYLARPQHMGAAPVASAAPAAAPAAAAPVQPAALVAAPAGAASTPAAATTSASAVAAAGPSTPDSRASAAAARPAAAPASRPARRASAAMAATASGSPAASAASAEAPVGPAARREPVVATSASAGASSRLVPPSETCKDKLFLMKTHCLQTECAKPGYQNFPACVRLREEARIREESDQLRR